MRKATLGLVGTCCLLFAQNSLAENFSVSYLEGQAQIRHGAAWINLAIGDVVPSEASIQLLSPGIVQLKGVDLEVILSCPGIYALKNVVSVHRLILSTGAGEALTTSLRHLIFGSSPNQDVQLGARGANKSKPEDESWSESSVGVFLAAGKEYIKAGKYAKAIEQFKEALESATEGESPEIHYYLAYASSLSGDVREAWKQAANLQPSTSDQWAADFILLKAKLLWDTSAYREAVTWLASNNLSQDAQRAPLYYFLLGLGYRGADESGGAKQALSKVVAISRENDLGKAAEELIQNP